MSVSLGHTHQSTPAHPTSSNLSSPSTLPVISCWRTVVQNKRRRVPKRPHRLQKTETDPAAALSRSSPSLRPVEKPEVSQGRYSCIICDLDYAQSQGLTRHQCEKHNARLCIYCRKFSWGRPYLFRKHLVKQHPGIDPDAAIDEATRIRRSATIRRGYPPLPQIPDPTTKCDSWGRAEFQSHPSHLTLSESTEPVNKEMHGREDALPSGLLNANDDRAASPSTGDIRKTGKILNWLS